MVTLSLCPYMCVCQHLMVDMSNTSRNRHSNAHTAKHWLLGRIELLILFVCLFIPFLYLSLAHFLFLSFSLLSFCFVFKNPANYQVSVCDSIFPLFLAGCAFDTREFTICVCSHENTNQRILFWTKVVVVSCQVSVSVCGEANDRIEVIKPKCEYAI